MARKRIPAETEIDALAAEFRALWKSGEPIRPWLRRHSEKLLTMVHGEWSWDTVARALTKAGITYSTSKPWTARVLTIEFVRATTPLKGYASRRNRSDQTPATQTLASKPSRTVSPVDATQGVGSATAADIQTSGGPSAPTTEPASRFKAFSLKPYEPPRELTPEEAREREANRLRMFGK